LFWLAAAGFAGAQLPVVTHSELQAVHADGTSSYTGPTGFVIRGILVTDADEMFDTAYDPEATNGGSVGAVYQMFIQGVEGDRGGTALYMAQNYEAIGPWVPVGNDYGPAWTPEVRRVLQDADGRVFRKGDLVEVTARISLFYSGKRNINENHRTATNNNFDVSLLKPNVGLPQAEVVAVSDLVREDGTQIFDATRAFGGEHWQGMRVRIDGLRLISTNGWCPTNEWAARQCRVEDADGRPFVLRLPRVDLGPPPVGFFTAVGILNQEGGQTNGYELFVQEIGPMLDLRAGASGGMELSFPLDYEGYVLEACDELSASPEWKQLDATPVLRVVVEDEDGRPTRSYRLKRKID
jgi:hypothetical protein